MTAVFAALAEAWGTVDFVLHSLAFAPAEDPRGRVVDCSPDGFLRAMRVSCHSFLEMARLAEPLMPRGGTLLTMTFYGAEKVVRHYNVMGPVKAALQSAARHLAHELGPRGIRLHALSPGPIRTRAASGLHDFDALEDLSAALNVTRLPAILKRRRLGYDGRGQAIVRSMCESVQAYAWRQLGGGPAIVETLVPFARELALIAVRARDGETRFYPLVETRHRDGILRSSITPAAATPKLHAQAQDYASRILDALRYVGVLTIEFFEHDGALIVNEIAPRVHNSGHWTIEGAETSQFENHLRAIVGLPLGSTAPVGCTALMNLIGAPPDPAAVLRLPDTHLHLYGKTAGPGRKIGHVIVRAPDRRTLAQRLEGLRQVLPAETKGDTPCDT